MSKRKKRLSVADKLIFAEARIAELERGARELGEFLTMYFPGAHVECEPLHLTCIRLLRGHRRALWKLRWGWKPLIEKPVNPKE